MSAVAHGSNLQIVSETLEILKKSPQEEDETYWQRVRREFNATKVSRSLMIIVPLVAVIEVSMSSAMLVIVPDHPMHMATFCARCGMDPHTYFDDFFANKPAGEVLDWMQCIEDEVLDVIGNAFQGFTANFLGSLVGHVLTVYALLSAQDAALRSDSYVLHNLLQFLGYSTLLVDLLIELGLLYSVEMRDPSHVDIRRDYDHCTSDVETQIWDIKEELLQISEIVLILRVVVSICVTSIYVIKNPVSTKELEEMSLLKENRKLGVARKTGRKKLELVRQNSEDLDEIPSLKLEDV